MRKKTLMLLAGTVGLLVAGCEPKQESSPAAAPSIPVIAAAPVIKDITVYLESIGMLHPSVYMEIRPRTNGTLLQVLVSEGQWVEQGTPLFIIDPKPYEIKVQEAEAQFVIDRASLNAVQKRWNRFKDLAQKDLVAQTEWDDLEAQVEKARGTLDLDSARLDSAKLDLEHCTLKSPIEGRVGKLDAHPGLLVSSGQTLPLVTISKMDPLLIEFTVTEKEFAKVPKDSLKIDLKPLCSIDQNKEGAVTFLDNHFDPKTGLLLLRGKVQNLDYSLRPGQNVRVRIPIAKAANAKLIPQKAIRYNQKGPYVYIVQQDLTVAIRQVILGEEQGTEQIVLEGVDPAELVILDGHLRLSPGLKVEIKS
jgi:membrane fusion protein, multidrug efflux system